MKVLALPLRLTYVAIYVAGSVVFNYFLGVIDYGRLPSDTGMWAAILVGGAVGGILSLQMELAIYRRVGQWPGNVSAFMLRAILMAIIWLSLGYTLTSVLASFQESTGAEIDAASWLLHMLVTPVLFTYMLAPAGLIAPFVGILNGLLLLYGTERRRRVVWTR